MAISRRSTFYRNFRTKKLLMTSDFRSWRMNWWGGLQKFCFPPLTLQFTPSETSAPAWGQSTHCIRPRSKARSRQTSDRSKWFQTFFFNLKRKCLPEWGSPLVKLNFLSGRCPKELNGSKLQLNLGRFHNFQTKGRE